MVGMSVAEKAAQKKQAQREIDAKKPAQSTMDWAALNQKWTEDAKAAEAGSLDATITAIEATTAGEVYGEKAKDPDRAVMNLEITASDGKVFHETFSLPEGAGSWRNKAFKLGIFVSKYGSAPVPGMAVKVGFNAEGFYKLEM